MSDNIGLVDVDTAQRLKQEYEEQAQRAKTNFEYYQRNCSEVCWKCHTVTHMYFITKASETACIDCVSPGDLEDNIWTVDRFRVVMGPLYAEYERLQRLYFGDSIDFARAKSQGPALLYFEGQDLYRKIETITDTFFKKLKDSHGRRLVDDRG